MSIIKLKRVDLKDGVQIPSLGMTKVINNVSPDGKKATLELDESRGVVKVTVVGQEPVFIFRESINAFREADAPKVPEVAKK